MSYEDDHIPTSNQVLMSNEIYREFMISQEEFEAVNGGYKYVMPGGLIVEPNIDEFEEAKTVVNETPKRNKSRTASNDLRKAVKAQILVERSPTISEIEANYPTPQNSSRKQSLEI